MSSYYRKNLPTPIRFSYLRPSTLVALYHDMSTSEDAKAKELAPIVYSELVLLLGRQTADELIKVEGL